MDAHVELEKKPPNSDCRLIWGDHLEPLSGDQTSFSLRSTGKEDPLRANVEMLKTRASGSGELEDWTGSEDRDTQAGREEGREDGGQKKNSKVRRKRGRREGRKKEAEREGRLRTHLLCAPLGPRLYNTYHFLLLERF